MPSLSRAQFRKMEMLYSQGQITKEQLDNFNEGVSYSSLPERVEQPPRNPLRGTRRKGQK